ncbi:hypothetical protein [Psychromonas sp. Urea-02u-13]|uniref:hypothetical protein n=1 Tax=Psychromonas sp. Urea-02u-13 TaxID=2058326 RepID=UPI000C340074|nr:hypothetical protein [Psychromonas sp. Urea-02u-13]PKG38165.1 hypothetical protein CXF74_15240 [Psychromonas sp. Urea-02u-13]
MIEIRKDIDGEEGGSLVVQIEQVKNFLHGEALKVRHFENIKYIMLGNQVSYNDAHSRYAEFLQGKEGLKIRPFGAHGVDMSDFFATSHGTTSFDTFSIYMCNLGLLIGLKELMDSGQSYKALMDDYKVVKSHCKQVQEKLVPEEVLVWRNKVAAHYALADARKDDNLATLMQSVNSWPCYSGSYYAVGAFKFGLGDDVSQIPEWSLTKVYDSLCPDVFSKPLPSNLGETFKAAVEKEKSEATQ